MLQRHIIYKQLQELQRRQQLLGFGEVRNQDYLDQLSSLKNGPGTQFPATVNLAPAHDPQMFMAGHMQMMQHGESNHFQGFHDGTIFSQGTNHGLGPMNLPQTEFGGSSYPSSLVTDHRNMNQHSHLQVPSNYTKTLLTKSDSSELEMHPSASPTSLGNQEYNLVMDQMGKSDDLLPTNEVLHENLHGHVSGQKFNSNLLPDKDYHQGSGIQGNTSNLTYEARHGDADSLDPLEQKILYNADDNIWETSFSRTSKMGEYDSVVDSSPYMDGFPSIQSGSWSALMQSAVAETSSSTTGGMQEEWSGMSFQNPEVSINDQPSNIMDGNNHQNNWVQKNNDEQLVPESNMNNIFPGFQRGHLKRKGEFQSEASHFSDQNHSLNMSHVTDNNHKVSHPTEVKEQISTSLLSPNRWPGHKESRENDGHQSSVISCTNDSEPDTSFAGNERSSFWPNEGTLHHVPAINPVDQLNQMNTHSYSVQSQKMGRSNNVETQPGFLGSSADPQVQNIIAHSRDVGDVLDKDGIFSYQTPEAHLTYLSKPWNALSAPQGLGFQQSPADPGTTQIFSQSPSFSMLQGNRGSPAASSDNVKEHIQNNSNARELLLKGQMAPPLFYSHAKNEEILSPNDPKSLTGTVRNMPSGDVQENSLIMRLNSVDTGQGRGIWPSSALNLATSKASPNVLPVDVSHQSSASLLPKKHKVVALDMKPWHQEVCEQLNLQNISVAHVEWAIASEEAQNAAEAVEDTFPLSRAKRRVIVTTNVMQEVFRAAPAVILTADASFNYDCIPYFSARIAIADACSRVNMLPAGTAHEGSPNTPSTQEKTRKRSFSHIVEDLIGRTKKLEEDLSRVDRSLSIVDVRIENQEIEKFGLLNRFAKFHIKANPTAASYGYRNLQRYVTGHPMPQTLPQAISCLSL